MAQYQLVARAGLDSSALNAGLAQAGAAVQVFQQSANAKLAASGGAAAGAAQAAAAQARNKMFAQAQGFIGLGPGGSLISGISGIHPAAALAVAALGRLKAGIVETIAVFSQQERADRRLRAAFETNGSPGVSIRQVEAFASRQQSRTNFGDEQTLNAAATLATFNNIRGDAFLGTLGAAQDASAFRGEDLEAMVLKFGKALNDPASKLGELAESGIAFSTAEVEAIKAIQKRGDLEAAQAKVLEKLNATFGGAAEKLAEPTDKLRNAFGDVLEMVGAFFKPIMDEFANAFLPVVSALGDADLRRAVNELGKAIAPLVVSFAKVVAFGPVLGTVVGKIGGGAEWLGNIIEDAANAMAYGFRNITDTLRIAGLELMATINKSTGAFEGTLLAAGRNEAIARGEELMAARNKVLGNTAIPEGEREQLAAALQKEIDRLKLVAHGQKIPGLPADAILGVRTAIDEANKRRLDREALRDEPRFRERPAVNAAAEAIANEVDKKADQAAARRAGANNLVLAGTQESFRAIRESLRAAGAGGPNKFDAKIESNTKETAEGVEDVAEATESMRDAVNGLVRRLADPQYTVVAFAP